MPRDPLDIRAVADEAQVAMSSAGQRVNRHEIAIRVLFGVLALVIAYSAVLGVVSLRKNTGTEQRSITTARKASSATKTATRVEAKQDRADVALRNLGECLAQSVDPPSCLQRRDVPGAEAQPGATGARGLQGPGPSDAQVRQGLVDICGPLLVNCKGPKGDTGAAGPTTTVTTPAPAPAKGDPGVGTDCAGQPITPGTEPATCPGRPGADGKDGTDGKDGAPGADSTVPGPAGPAPAGVESACAQPDGTVANEITTDPDGDGIYTCPAPAAAAPAP